MPLACRNHPPDAHISPYFILLLRIPLIVFMNTLRSGILFKVQIPLKQKSLKSIMVLIYKYKIQTFIFLYFILLLRILLKFSLILLKRQIRLKVNFKGIHILF